MSAGAAEPKLRLVTDEESWSLPAWTYRDEHFLALEREKIFRPAWQLVCHVSDIPRPGDYQTFALLGERAVVVRGRDGAIRAFHNICRHRAARLLDGERGHCGGRITCPYHAWSYGLDGKLIGVPFMEEYENFDRADFGLVPIEHDVFAGFIYIRFAPGGPSPGLDSLVRNTYRLSIDRGVDKIFASVEAVNSAGPSVQAYRRLLPRIDHLAEERQGMWTYWRLFPSLMFDVYPDQIDFMTPPAATCATALMRCPTAGAR
jgi:nitrite reductase/ring-hydroxylating ferredoxin subunit